MSLLDIKNFLYNLQGRFTFRKKLVFFSLIFSLGMPIPIYYYLSTQFYIIRLEESKVQGLYLYQKFLHLINEAYESQVLTDTHAKSFEKFYAEYQDLLTSDARLINALSLPISNFVELRENWMKQLELLKRIYGLNLALDEFEVIYLHSLESLDHLLYLDNVPESVSQELINSLSHNTMNESQLIHHNHHTIYKQLSRYKAKKISLRELIWAKIHKEEILLQDWQSLLFSRLFRYKLELMIFYLICFIAFFVVVAFITLRVATRHFDALNQHIQNLIKGKFVNCFCADAKDEFGPIGKAFNRMGSSVQTILEEIKGLSHHLHYSIQMILNQKKSRETNLEREGEALKRIKNYSNKMLTSSKQLVEDGLAINSLAKQKLIEDIFQRSSKGLIVMQEQIMELTISSNQILKEIDGMFQLVIDTKSFLHLLKRTSQHAQLIALNSSIENASFQETKNNFNKITLEVQRFSSNTFEATENIKRILDEIAQHIIALRKDADFCLREIVEAVRRLIMVKEQMRYIAIQSHEQAKKLNQVNIVIDSHVSEVNQIDHTIELLNTQALQNIQSMRDLHQACDSLSHFSQQLESMSKNFFSQLEGK